jgi:hypothetical protein
MSTLRYRSHSTVEDLAVGECTVHRAADEHGGRWWLLWFRVSREDNELPIDVAVPINPNGGYVASGPGGKTWGLTRASIAGTWQVSPSINVLAGHEAQVHPGPHAAPSLWHQTPSIVEVPDDEAWISGAP